MLSGSISFLTTYQQGKKHIQLLMNKWLEEFTPKSVGLHLAIFPEVAGKNDEKNTDYI